jgi:hypothetical protein
MTVERAILGRRRNVGDGVGGGVKMLLGRRFENVGSNESTAGKMATRFGPVAGGENCRGYGSLV